MTVRVRRAAFAVQAPGEAYLTISFGIPACEGYIRAQIARDLEDDPALCAPPPITRLLHPMSWYRAATRAVLGHRSGFYRARTEVDQAMKQQFDPNATVPIEREGGG
jgi:hypothetical protein